MTIVDVAKEAGVSKSTVSLVLNNSPKVKSETRLKVQAAIDKLGYTPNLSAVELTTKRKLNIGMILVTNHDTVDRTSFDTMDDNYYHDVSSGIFAAMAKENYGILVEQFTATASNSHKIPHIVKTERVDGLFIVGGLFDDSFMLNLRKREIPMVIMGRTYPGIDSVNTDSEYASYLAVTYLIENGHRRILYLSGPDLTPSSEAKDKGVRLAYLNAGIEFDTRYYIKSEFTGLGGYLAVKEAFEDRGIRPTAIFTSNDSMALGAMRYLYEKKIRIPDEISIATYDDSILSTYASPALTCVKINKEQIGREAAALLLRRIHQPETAVNSILVPVNLVKRDSVCRI